MEYIKYNFFNRNFEYSLFFQEYFKTVRNINNNIKHFEHSEYTAFFNATLEMVPKNKIIIDVGANSGLFCIPMCLYGYYSIAFEPVSSNLKCLEMGIESNNLNNLKLSSYALSNENKSMEIYVPNSQDNSSLIKEVSTSNLSDKSFTIENINSIRLDDYISDNNINIKSIGLVKIDVQGYELNVIEGMINVLSESDDLVLIIEWDIHHSGHDSLQKMSDILNNFNFKEIEYPGIVVGSNDSGNKIYKKI